MDILLVKPPLTPISQSKYLDRRPSYSALTIPNKTNYSHFEKCLISGFAMLHKAGELYKDSESKAIMRKTQKVVNKKVSKKDFISLELEINSKIMKLSDDLYLKFNSSMVGLNLLRIYFNSLSDVELVNNKPLKKLINKQLDYMKNGASGDLFRDSRLMAENIARFLQSEKDFTEVAKTSEEIAKSIKKKALARRVTNFEFMGIKYTVKGEHLTLEECINKFCEARYINDFKTFKSREFFINKYEVKHENN